MFVLQQEIKWKYHAKSIFPDELDCKDVALTGIL
jgi:hypothetical protein